MVTPLLHTRQFKPPITSEYISRGELVANLQRSRNKALSLIKAPTGYGKSMLVSDWLDHSGNDYCWISIDEELDNPESFFRHLIYDLSNRYPDIFNEYHAIIDNMELPPENVLNKIIINGLNKIDTELNIVLDDYHHISTLQIHGFVETFLRLPPPGVHLVIISRKEPELNLNRFRSFDTLNELNELDLQFSSEELVKLADSIYHIKLSQKDTKAILEYTEGWPVGLRMALHYLSNSKNIDKSLKELKINKSYLVDYLLDETFVMLPENVRELLLITSVTPRFNYDLIFRIISETDSALNREDLEQTFDTLIETAQFIIPLDNKKSWYRFHHFYLEFLYKMLKGSRNKKELKSYHKSASRYFECLNDFELSIQHAVKAGDLKQVLHIFGSYKHKLLNQDQFTRLTQWLEYVPKTWIESEPELLLTQAFLRDNSSDYPSMQSDLNKLQEILPDPDNELKDTKRWWGEFYASYSILTFLTGRIPEAISASEKALALLPPRPLYFRDIAFFYYAFALRSLGHIEKYRKLIDTELLTIPATEKESLIRVWTLSAILHAVDGNIDEMIKVTHSSLQHLKKSKLFVSLIFSTYFYHTGYYLKNDLSKTMITLEDLNRHIYLGRPFWGLNLLFTRALVLNALGEEEGLQSVLDHMHQFAGNYSELQLAGLVKAFEAELFLMQGNINKAIELSLEANFDPYPPFCFAFFPQLTQIKIWAFTGKKTLARKALKELNELIQFGNKSYRTNLLLTALPLKALILHNLGNENECRSTLIEALSLSKLHGYIRNILDLGPNMQMLIEEYLYKDLDHAYLKAVWQAFLEDNLRKQYAEPLNVKDSFIDPQLGKIKITIREVRLLKMLNAELQNKEIAKELGISSDSVKKSLYRLYKKLGVHNRASAIYKAIEEGLIKF